jgi:hypothetical protein
MPAALTARLRNNALVVNTLFVLVALLFSYYFASLRLAKPEWERCSLDVMVAGTANTPFQYRVLVPWIVGWFADHLLPLPFIRTPRGLAFLIEIGSTFFLLVSFRRFLGFFFANPGLRTLLSLTLLLVLPFNFLMPRMYPFWLVYDMPSLLFFTLGLILIHERRWVLYYPLFLAATFNRETTCFLTLIYMFTAAGKDKPGRITLHCLAQFLIWMAIKQTLGHLYAANPGAGLAVFNIGTNVREILLHPQILIQLASSIGYLWLPVMLYWPLIGNAFLKRACLVGPVFLVAMALIANLPEVRIYGEMIPLFLPAFLLILKELFKSEPAVPPSP